jgi:hypothetical protein
MARHLLRPPREIRNTIYEYVLTEEEGICYRKDESGRGRLCIYVPEKGEDVVTCQPIRSSELSAHSEQLTFKDKQTSFLQTKGRNWLNKCFFSFLLDGVGARVDGDKVFIRAANYGEAGEMYIIANQLQFTCRQLSRETRCLSLRYNTIIISANDEGQASDRYIDFLQDLPSKYVRWISTIDIQHWDDGKMAYSPD